MSFKDILVLERISDHLDSFAVCEIRVYLPNPQMGKMSVLTCLLLYMADTCPRATVGAPTFRFGNSYPFHAFWKYLAVV